MRSSYLLPICAFAFATRVSGSSPPAESNEVIQISTVLDALSIHKNTLASIDPAHVTTSDAFYDYFASNPTGNYTVYLNDTQEFIHLTHVKEVVTKRQYSQPCYGYKSYWVEQVQHWWGSWDPASSCYWNGNSPLPATLNLNWSKTLSITTSTGVDFTVIEKILSLTGGIQVTKSWSKGGAMTCQIPGRSVGQIWVQNKITWGWVWSQDCQSCGVGRRCDNQRALGGASAPAKSEESGVGVQYGCSTGRSKVRC